jgi:hypothetical protein
MSQYNTMKIPSLLQTTSYFYSNNVPKKSIKQGLPRSSTFLMRASGALFLFIMFVVLADYFGFAYTTKSLAEEINISVIRIKVNLSLPRFRFIYRRAILCTVYLPELA